MEIRVSRLNQRMALQLPAELPLGLVFVVGEVQLTAAAEKLSGNNRPAEFYLEDDGYRLPCRLSERAAEEFHLEAGDKIRAGGHLVFEPSLASYYLLARDVERLDGFRPAAKPLAAIIADNSRRKQANALTPAELPPWVQDMAPPEVRSEGTDSLLSVGMVMTAAELNGDWELLADTGAAVAYPQAEPALADLSDELIAFLSQAMDSELEVEITPEIMIDLNTTGTTDRLSPEVLEALDLFEASVSQELPSQELEGQAPAPTAVASPEAQVMAWLEPEADDGQATLTAAEVAAALESAAADETAGERAQPAPRPKTAAARKKEQVGRSNNANDTVPWVVAILIILIIAMLLGLVVYFAMFPNNLPIDLSLDLPQELPFLN
jgi:hypothetical protein